MVKNKIKKELSKQGVSINELANRMGRSYSPVHDLVHREDVGDTTLITMLKTAKALGVDVSDLYEWEE